MSYWIFVASETSGYHRGNKKEIKSFLKKERKWPIGNHTIYRKKIEPGDKMLFYLSGDNNKKFIGSGVLNSIFEENTLLWNYVDIKDVDIFKMEVPIKPLLEKMEFIKNTKYWGLYLQNGIVKISKEDYERILNQLE